MKASCVADTQLQLRVLVPGRDPDPVIQLSEASGMSGHLDLLLPRFRLLLLVRWRSVEHGIAGDGHLGTAGTGFTSRTMLLTPLFDFSGALVRHRSLCAIVETLHPCHWTSNHGHARSVQVPHKAGDPATDSTGAILLQYGNTPCKTIEIKKSPLTSQHQIKNTCRT